MEDKYSWYRFIVSLVELGFGNYRECAEAELTEAILFYYLRTRQTADDKIRDFLNG